MKKTISLLIVFTFFITILSSSNAVQGEIQKGRVLSGNHVGTGFEDILWNQGNASNKPYYVNSNLYGITYSTSAYTGPSTSIAQNPSILEHEDNSFLRYRNEDTLEDTVINIAPTGDTVVDGLERSSDLPDLRRITDNFRETQAAPMISLNQVTTPRTHFFNNDKIEVISPNDGQHAWGDKLAKIRYDEYTDAVSGTGQGPWGLGGWKIPNRGYDVVSIPITLPLRQLRAALIHMSENQYYSVGLFLDTDDSDVEWTVQSTSFTRMCWDPDDVGHEGTPGVKWNDNHCPQAAWMVSPPSLPDSRSSGHWTPRFNFQDGEMIVIPIHKTMLDLLFADLARDYFYGPSVSDEVTTLSVILKTDSPKIDPAENVYFDFAWLGADHGYHTVEYAVREPVEQGFEYSIGVCLDPGSFYPSNPDPTESANYDDTVLGRCNGVRIANNGVFTTTALDGEWFQLSSNDVLADGEWHKIIVSFDYVSETLLNYTAYIGGEFYTGDMLLYPSILTGNVRGIYLQVWTEGSTNNKYLDFDDIYFYEEYYSIGAIEYKIDRLESIDQLLQIVQMIVMILIFSAVAATFIFFFSDGGRD